MFFRPGPRAFTKHSSPLHQHYTLLLRKTFVPSPTFILISNVGGRCVHLQKSGIRKLYCGSLTHRAECWRSTKKVKRLPPFFEYPARTMSLSTSAPEDESSAGPPQMSASSLVNPADSDEKNPTPEESHQADAIVQYIVIRKDLVVGLNWPLGSVISQGCHAAVAAIWTHKDDPMTLKYCAPENLDNMHKVTLEVKGEAQLRSLAEKLEAGGVGHKLWFEQPENYATCLATKPYYKSEVSAYFKKLKLCK